MTETTASASTVTNTILSEFTQAARDATKLGSNLIGMLDCHEITNGVDIVHLKSMLLSSYNVNLVHLCHERISQTSFANSPTLNRLVTLRTVLEKLRPIEHKMKYQVDKLLKAAIQGASGSTDKLQAKPHPDLMDGDGMDDSEADDEDGGEMSKIELSDKYIPPKLMAMHYDDGKSRESKDNKINQRRALNRTLIDELQSEFRQTPEEIHDVNETHLRKYFSEERHKKQYEEDNLMRLPVTKKERNLARKIQSGGAVGSILDISDILPKKRRKFEKGVKKPVGGKRSSKGSGPSKFSSGRKKR